MQPPAEMERYPDEEAQRRFEIALRAALNMPHEPHKVVKGKGRSPKTERKGLPSPKRGERP